MRETDATIGDGDHSLRGMADLGGLTEAVERRLREIDRQHVVDRIWSRDHTVWKPDPREIADRLGWLTSVEWLRTRVPELEQFGEEIRAEGVTNVVLLGMGGSS